MIGEKEIERERGGESFLKKEELNKWDLNDFKIIY